MALNLYLKDAGYVNWAKVLAFSHDLHIPYLPYLIIIRVTDMISHIVLYEAVVGSAYLFLH